VVFGEAKSALLEAQRRVADAVGELRFDLRRPALWLINGEELLGLIVNGSIYGSPRPAAAPREPWREPGSMTPRPSCPVADPRTIAILRLVQNGALITDGIDVAAAAAPDGV
jgi:hypothetical protein